MINTTVLVDLQTINIYTRRKPQLTAVLTAASGRKRNADKTMDIFI
jgi:hypothetical protein